MKTYFRRKNGITDDSYLNDHSTSWLSSNLPPNCNLQGGLRNLIPPGTHLPYGVIMSSLIPRLKMPYFRRALPGIRHWMHVLPHSIHPFYNGHREWIEKELLRQTFPHWEYYYSGQKGFDQVATPRFNIKVCVHANRTI